MGGDSQEFNPKGGGKGPSVMAESWGVWEAETSQLVQYSGIANMSHVLRRSHRGHAAFRGVDLDFVDSICERVENEIALVFHVAERATGIWKKRELFFYEARVASVLVGCSRSYFDFVLWGVVHVSFVQGDRLQRVFDEHLQGKWRDGVLGVRETAAYHAMVAKSDLACVLTPDERRTLDVLVASMVGVLRFFVLIFGDDEF